MLSPSLALLFKGRTEHMPRTQPGSSPMDKQEVRSEPAPSATMAQGRAPTEWHRKCHLWLMVEEGNDKKMRIMYNKEGFLGQEKKRIPRIGWGMLFEREALKADVPRAQPRHGLLFPSY